MISSPCRSTTALLLALSMVMSLSDSDARRRRRKRRADLEFAPETVKKSAAPSKTLSKALRLYESRDFYSASIEFHRVVERKSRDGIANRQLAEFWMGKTLYHLRFYSAALSYFDRVVQTGPSHRYFSATLKWLATLSNHLPESAGILKKVGVYDISQLEQPQLAKVRDELRYLLGRHHYREGNLEQAIGLFGDVPEDSPFFARAKFMEGISQVRRYKAKPAAEAFKQLLRAAKLAPDTEDIEYFEQMALLSLARVFYSTGDYQRSAKYYAKVSADSINWLSAQFESAWAHYQRNKFSRTLGNIHTVNSPFFENYFFPESLILKAVVYWKHCLYDRSDDALREFNARYPELKKSLEQLLKRYEDPTDFYQVALQLGRGESELSPSVARLASTALSDRTLSKAFEYVGELERELKQVQASDPAWQQTAIAAVVLEDLALQQSLAQREAGTLAQRRLSRLIREIRELQKQAIRVEYEIINGRKNSLEAAVSQERVVAKNLEQRATRPNDEQHYWPFTGEYWRDELGYYRVGLLSRCTQ